MLDEAALLDTANYPELSLLYARDALRRRSQTCSTCGTHLLAVYHCVDAKCWFGHCYGCWSQRHYRDAAVNTPMPDDYLLPAPQEHSALMCHPRRSDMTHIVDPFVSLSIRGIAPGRRGSVPFCAAGDDLALLAGRGVYPFVVPFVPISGTPLEDHAAPSPEFMKAILAPLGAMVSNANMRSADIKAGCGKCGACSSLSVYES